MARIQTDGTDRRRRQTQDESYADSVTLAVGDANCRQDDDEQRDGLVGHRGERVDDVTSLRLR